MLKLNYPREELIWWLTKPSRHKCRFGHMILHPQQYGYLTKWDCMRRPYKIGCLPRWRSSSENELGHVISLLHKMRLLCKIRLHLKMKLLTRWRTVTRRGCLPLVSQDMVSLQDQATSKNSLSCKTWVGLVTIGFSKLVADSKQVVNFTMLNCGNKIHTVFSYQIKSFIPGEDIFLKALKLDQTYKLIWTVFNKKKF